MNDDYLNQIRKVAGAEELCALLERWDRLIGYSRKMGKPMCMFFPDMLWTMPTESGKTDLLRLVTEHLAAAGGVIRFNGNVKFLEYHLPYCPPDRPFQEFKTLMGEVEKAAGVRLQFHGLVHIELDEWVRHGNDRYFRQFLEFLNDQSEDWIIVLSFSGWKTEELKDIEAVLCSYLRLEIVRFASLSDEALVDLIGEQLKEQELTLSEDARKLLCGTIAKLRESPHFDELKTVTMVAKDIIYQCLSEAEENAGELTASQLYVFREDGEYVRRQIRNSEIRHLGFT